MKNLYKIENDLLGASVTVEVDDEKMPDDMLEQINGFWSGAEDRLLDADDNLLNAVLTLLAETVFRIQFSDDLNTYGVVKAFENLEGWPTMDGTYGFKIIDAESFEIDPFDISIQKMASA